MKYFILVQKQGKDKEIINIFNGKLDISEKKNIELIECSSISELQKKAKSIDPEWESKFRITFFKTA